MKLYSKNNCGLRPYKMMFLDIKLLLSMLYIKTYKALLQNSLCKTLSFSTVCIMYLRNEIRLSRFIEVYITLITLKVNETLLVSQCSLHFDKHQGPVVQN